MKCSENKGTLEWRKCMNLEEIEVFITEDIVHVQRCNKRIYRIGLALICITLGICLLLYSKLHIDSPVVLPVCMEIMVETADFQNRTESASFILYYVNNRGAKEQLSSVSMPEYSDWICYGTDEVNRNGTYTLVNSSSSVCRYVGGYEIHMIYVSLQNIPLQEKVEINQLNLHWNSGKITTEDIGKIVIFNDLDRTRELNQYSSSTNSDGVTSITCKANTDMMIQSLQTNLLPDELTDLTVIVNGEEYEMQKNLQFSIPLKLGEDITLTFRRNKLSSESRWNQYSIMPKLVYHTSSGEEGNCRLWSIRHEQYWRSQWKLYRYIKNTVMK